MTSSTTEIPIVTGGVMVVITWLILRWKVTKLLCCLY